MHVLKVQQRRLLWNVCIRRGMLAPSKPMAKLQLTSTGLEFPPRSPSSHRGTVALLACNDFILHFLDKIPGSERPLESLHWWTCAKTIPRSVWSSVFECFMSSYSEISLPMSMNDEDSYLVLEQTKHIMICSTSALQFAMAAICNIYTTTSQAL